MYTRLLAQRLFPIHDFLVQLDQDHCPLRERIRWHGVCGNTRRLCGFYELHTLSPKQNKMIQRTTWRPSSTPSTIPAVNASQLSCDMSLGTDINWVRGG